MLTPPAGTVRTHHDARGLAQAPLDDHDGAVNGGPGFPAGWYPDPWAVGARRWWDGERWTGWYVPGRPGHDAAGGAPGSSFQRYGVIWILAIIFGFMLFAAVLAVVHMVSTAS